MQQSSRFTLTLLVLTAMLAQGQPLQRRSVAEDGESALNTFLSESKLMNGLLAFAIGIEKRAVPTYQAVTFAEDKRTILGVMLGALAVSATVGFAAIRSLDHHACMYVQRQEEVMQHKWDLNHPDGFIPAGGQLRPATFNCKEQERPFRPLRSYRPSDFY